ncbi:protein bicaudal D homolog 2-like isoform X1 [Scleropages formosus]|uniref:protein bicaudal D homolog 2-like isoform X1 n=1 Tax=Scleropages formosus TaxID=113540 RepID=UPI0010FAACD8|nr:protein bicaudal D homolog 2-like isoform X1 [Scleropages formosus]XP_018604646.2 protein bicaudal D homolog 2-like isoform X1 [Scleropages formosus]XP_018604647.2 protein bicaudal D homolog 2-like isoform X1 [Scleropages formosus]
MLEDGEAGDPCASLRAEVERLKLELQEVNEEKLQAARYGLAVLEESTALKSKHRQLEEEHETLRQEVKQLREALAESVSSQKRVAADGESREETLLRETATKEAAMAARLEEVQGELRQARIALDNTQAESERLGALYVQLKTEFECIEAEKNRLRDEMKEYKARELQQLQDNSELEEENISLQKQISVLKENQVEFEAVKLELTHKEEEQELLRGQLEEAGRLREIAERQLEEALEGLKEEREQKNSLRRELSALAINPFDSVSNLELHLEQLEESQNGGGGEDQDSGYNNGFPLLATKAIGHHRYSTPRNSDVFLRAPAPGLVSDLLSELHLSDSQKLKQQLAQAEKEKAFLSSTVQNLQEERDACRAALNEEKSKMVTLTKQLDDLQSCRDILLKKCENRESIRPQEGTESGINGEGRLTDLGDGADLLERGMLATSKELAQLREDLKEAKNRYETLEGKYHQEKERWKSEAQELAEKIRQCIKSSRQDQERILELEKEIRATMKAASDSESHLTNAQEELLTFSEELASLYHHICVSSNLTPVRVTLDYYRRGGRVQHAPHQRPLHKRCSSDLLGKMLHTADMDTRSSGGNSGDSSPSSPGASSCPGSPTLDFRDPINVRSLVAVIRSQMKHLQVAVDLCRQRVTLSSQSSRNMPDTERDTEALLEEVLKLRSLLSTKREQIATLRTVLKGNKQAAEVALTSLKTKYESERSAVSEAVVKLRNELKALKEDAATFSALRTMFASRCDQYVTQLDEMQRQLAAAEDEKKTLNSLLRMAIQQKLALTQRLEDLEAPLGSLSNTSSPRRSRTKRMDAKSRIPRSPHGSPVRPLRSSPCSSSIRNGNIQGGGTRSP